MFINNFPIKVLLDTGCSGALMLINEKIVHKNKLEQHKLDLPFSVRLGDGSISPQQLYTSVTVPLTIPTLSTSITVPLQAVMFNSPYDAILGLQFFQLFSPIIDFKHNNIKTLTPPSITINSITKNYQQSTIPVNEVGIPILYKQFTKLFVSDTDSNTAPLPNHSHYDLSIELTSNNWPKPAKSYPLSATGSLLLQQYITKALKNNWIRPSKSPLAASCFFVPKPNNKHRLCINYKPLNSITKKNAYPIPRSDNLINLLQHAKIFTRIDLPDAYHLVRIKKGDEWKTAFRCPLGHFEYLVIPFGLTNAPASFQSMMHSIMDGILNVFVIIYIDDILIFSNNPIDHYQHVSEVLKRLANNNLPVKLEKCSFHVTELDFLGFLLTTKGITVHNDTITTLQNYPTPTTKKQLQSFLGFINFYRNLVPNCAKITTPLYNALSEKPYKWTPQLQHHFQSIINNLINSDIVNHPDLSKPLILETDASKFAMGAVLKQKINNKLVTVAIASKKLDSAQINYSTFDRELLAIIYFLEQFKHHILSSPFRIKILCDHKNLSYFATII